MLSQIARMTDRHNHNLSHNAAATPPPMRRAGRCPADEIRSNMGSIERCPPDILPVGSLPWFALLLLAACGHDTYVYQAAGPSGIWNAWIGPLNEATHGQQGRVPIARLGAGCRRILGDELAETAPEVVLLCQLLDEQAHLWDWAGFLIDPREAAIELLEAQLGGQQGKEARP